MTTWTQIKAWHETMKAVNMPTPEGMLKALTVCQPYAEEIVRPSKWVENRTWYTAYRGPLLIHAGKSRAWLMDTDDELEHRYGRRLEFGALVGIVNLVDCVRMADIEAGKYEAKYAHLMLPNHRHHVNGPWCFVLEDAYRFNRPIPFRGAQGFYLVPSSVLIAAEESQS